LSFGAYLTHRWLPAKRNELKDSTWAGYAGKVRLHIVPTLGAVPIRRLRPQQLEALYDRMPHPTDGERAYAPKMVLEVHQVIRRSLADAVERGLLTRNVALLAHAPKLRAIPTVEHQAWDAEQLHTFLRTAAGTATSPLCGSPRSPGCAAANSSGSDGATSTSNAPPCR
jgi:integrase